MTPFFLLLSLKLSEIEESRGEESPLPTTPRRTRFPTRTPEPTKSREPLVLDTGVEPEEIPDPTRSINPGRNRRPTPKVSKGTLGSLTSKVTAGIVACLVIGCAGFFTFRQIRRARRRAQFPLAQH